MRQTIVYPVLIVLMLAPGQLKAQFAEAGLFSGIGAYQGDLNTDRLAHKVSPAAGMFVRFNHHQRFSSRVSATYGMLRGSDRSTEQTHSNILNEPAYPVVYYEFETRMAELSVMGELHLRTRDRQRLEGGPAPYLFVGIGAIYFDPFPLRLSNGGTQSEPANGAHRHPDDDPDYPNLAVAGLAGGGVTFRLSPRLSAGMEFGMRFTGTDYIDEVSHKGDPGKNDRYVFTGLVLTYGLDYYRNRSSGRGCPY